MRSAVLGLGCLFSVLPLAALADSEGAPDSSRGAPSAPGTPATSGAPGIPGTPAAPGVPSSPAGRSPFGEAALPQPPGAEPAPQDGGLAPPAERDADRARVEAEPAASEVGADAVAEPTSPDWQADKQRISESTIDAYSLSQSEHDGSSGQSSGADVLRLGPVVGVGLPNVLSFGGMLKITPYFGAGVNVGLIPTMKLAYYGDATLSYQEADVYARLFPFGNAFFVGAGLGYATVSATLAGSVATDDFGLAGGRIDATSSASVRTMIVAPQLGVFKTWGAGFSLGIDVGVQIPIAPSQIDAANPDVVVSGLPSAFGQQLAAQAKSYAAANQKKALDTLETVGRSVLPTLSLRVGWLL